MDGNFVETLKEGGAIGLAMLSIGALAYALRCCMSIISNDLKHLTEVLIEVKGYLKKLNGG